MMSRSLLCLVLVAGASTSAAPPEQHKPRLDALGDPLPQGAIVRLGTNRFRQQGGAHAIALSPDGKCLASRNGGSVVLWDAVTALPRWQRHDDKVSLAAPLVFSDDGKYLAVVTPSAVVLLDTSSGREIRHFPITAETPTGVWIAGKTVLAATKEGMLRWWDVATGKQVRAWDFFDNNKPTDLGNGFAAVVPTFVGLSDDGRLAAFRVHIWGRHQAGAAPTLEEATVRVFELATRKERWHGELKLDKSLQLRFPESGLVATGTGIIASLAPSGDIVVAEFATGKVRHQLRADPDSKADIIALAVSGAGKHIAAVRNDAQLHCWDAATGRLRLRLANGVTLISASRLSLPLSLSGDGKRLALVDNRKVLVVRETETGQTVPNLPGHRGGPVALEWSPDGQRLSSSSIGEPYLFWDAKTGKPTASAPPPGSLRILDDKCVSVATNHYLSYDRMERLFLCELDTGKRLRQLSIDPHGYLIAGLSPDGNVLVRFNDKQRPTTTLQLYDLARNRQICRIDQVSYPDSWIVSRDGSRIAWWRYDGQVWVADAATGKNVRAFGKKQSDEKFYQAALSADGSHLVLGPCAVEGTEDEVEAQVWDLVSGKQVGRVGDIPSNVQALALSPDGRQCAVRLWEDVSIREVHSGQERLKLSGHREGVTAMTFSPDGAYIATGSEDTTALIWDLFGQHEVARRKLTLPEAERLWKDLADAEAKRAFAAMRTLTGDPDATLALLRAKLRPASQEAERRLHELRALEILERIATPQARKLLEELSRGAPQADLTQQAKAALRRLS